MPTAVAAALNFIRSDASLRTIAVTPANTKAALDQISAGSTTSFKYSARGMRDLLMPRHTMYQWFVESNAINVASARPNRPFFVIRNAASTTLRIPAAREENPQASSFVARELVEMMELCA